MDIVELNQMTGDVALSHWYYRSKFLLLKREVAKYPVRPARHLVDVGSGSGIYLTLLERSNVLQCEAMHGVDIAYHSPVRAVQGSAWIYPEWQSWAKADFVTLMDVLEHIEEDRRFLAQITDQVEKGARFFITVPAFPFLWSNHDILLKHYRRYTLSTLGDLISSVNDLKIIRISYYFATILPLVSIIRLLGRKSKSKTTDLKPVLPPINTFMRLLLKCESTVSALNKFGGLSVVAVAQKV